MRSWQEKEVRYKTEITQKDERISKLEADSRQQDERIAKLQAELKIYKDADILERLSKLEKAPKH